MHIDTSVLTLLGMVMGFVLQMYQTYKSGQKRADQHAESLQAIASIKEGKSSDSKPIP